MIIFCVKVWQAMFLCPSAKRIEKKTLLNLETYEWLVFYSTNVPYLEYMPHNYVPTYFGNVRFACSVRITNVSASHGN